MPIGIITNTLAVLIGGLLGAAIKNHLPQTIKDGLTYTFGFAAIAIGIVLVIKVEHLGAMVLALIVGSALGILCKLEARVNKGIHVASARLLGNTAGEDFIGLFSPVMVLFCASGTGLYGALVEGFTGDASILLAKSVLDFFTAVLFGALLGRLMALVSIPQAVIYATLFALSQLVGPHITAAMLANFSAVGGIVTIAAGFRIAGVQKKVSVINMLPGLVLVFPFTALWQLLPV